MHACNIGFGCVYRLLPTFAAVVMSLTTALIRLISHGNLNLCVPLLSLVVASFLVYQVHNLFVVVSS